MRWHGGATTTQSTDQPANITMPTTVLSTTSSRKSHPGETATQEQRGRHQPANNSTRDTPPSAAATSSIVAAAARPRCTAPSLRCSPPPQQAPTTPSISAHHSAQHGEKTKTDQGKKEKKEKKTSTPPLRQKRPASLCRKSTHLQAAKPIKHKTKQKPNTPHANMKLLSPLPPPSSPKTNPSRPPLKCKSKEQHAVWVSFVASHHQH